MASLRPLIRFGLGCAIAACAMIPQSTAQVLPDLGTGVTDTIGDRDRRIEETVERDIERELEDLSDALGETVLLDDTGRLLGSVEIGNTLEETMSLAGDLGLDLIGVTALPDKLVPGRAVDLDVHDGWTVIRNEWIVIVPTARAAEVEALDVDIVERSELVSSDQTLFTVSFTATSATASAIESQLNRLGAEPFDRNHVYRGASPETEAAGEPAPVNHSKLPAPSAETVRVGLIDTDVDESHDAFAGLALFEADFVSHGDLRPQGHGTATASILASGSKSNGKRELLAASAFFLANDGTTGATSASLIGAIDWLAANKVSVVNVSLTGPPNRALEAMIRKHQAEGVVFVAAVGNEGPASGPLYPAAYDDVIGVTAVDGAGRIYRWANRGPFVDVAAVGVNVLVAKPGGATGQDSGTSYAAPVVSAFLAGWTGAASMASAAPAEMIRVSVGADTQARDDTFGYGILQPRN